MEMRACQLMIDNCTWNKIATETIEAYRSLVDSITELV
jgi:hypothetical protein